MCARVLVTPRIYSLAVMISEVLGIGPLSSRQLAPQVGFGVSEKLGFRVEGLGFS